MRTKKDKRGQKHELRISKLDHPIRHDKENSLRDVNERVEMSSLKCQK